MENFPPEVARTSGARRERPNLCVERFRFCTANSPRTLGEACPRKATSLRRIRRSPCERGTPRRAARKARSTIRMKDPPGFEERRDIGDCGPDIERSGGGFVQTQKCGGRQRGLALPVPRLPHSFLEVRQVDRSLPPEIPDHVVPVPSLDPVAPCPAQNRVHLSRKQPRQTENPGLKESRLEHRTQPGFETSRRSDVHFYFYLENPAAGDPRKLRNAYGRKLYGGIRLQEG